MYFSVLSLHFDVFWLNVLPGPLWRVLQAAGGTNQGPQVDRHHHRSPCHATGRWFGRPRRRRATVRHRGIGEILKEQKFSAIFFLMAAVVVALRKKSRKMSVLFQWFSLKIDYCLPSNGIRWGRCSVTRIVRNNYLKLPLKKQLSPKIIPGRSPGLLPPHPRISPQCR